MSRANCVRKGFIALFVAFSLGVSGQASSAQTTEHDWTSRVLRLVAVHADGRREQGSAVPLSPEHLVTNCHVLRASKRVEVEWHGRTFLAFAKQQDAYRDLCLLNVPGLDAEAVPMIEMGQTKVGLEVIAVGYPGGNLSITSGRVIGLYSCECDGGKVIQTSASFDQGASGGGLFDRQGRLVGILSFKARTGGNFHFVLPVGWLRHLAENRIDAIAAGSPFWEQPGKESSYFLAACDLGAKKSWSSLIKLATEWTEQEPYNPEAWMALGRACQGLDQTEKAVYAFQKVLMLDSTHAEAKWALQQLEFELGRNLLDVDGI